MNKGTLWTWIGAAVIGVGLAGTASAEPGDRDRESGRMRMQDVQRTMSTREAQAARPDSGTSVTGRELGADAVARGDYKREFKNAADMKAHMTQAVKIRGSEGQAPSDGGAGGSPSARMGHEVSNPAAYAAKLDDELLLRHSKQVNTEPGDGMTEHEKQVLTKSATGRAIGQDSLQLGAAYKDPLAQARAKSLHAMHPSAGTPVGDPTRLDDESRANLATQGFTRAAKKTSSSDIEDKGR